MRYFFDKQTGDYLGAFDEGSIKLVPSDAIEVDTPPAHGKDKYINGGIIPYKDTAEELLKLYEGQSEEIQADFSPLFVAVDQYLKTGKESIAKKIIERATVPVELIAVKQEMLKKFK